MLLLWFKCLSPPKLSGNLIPSVAIFRGGAFKMWLGCEGPDCKNRIIHLWISGLMGSWINTLSQEWSWWLCKKQRGTWANTLSPLTMWCSTLLWDSSELPHQQEGSPQRGAHDLGLPNLHNCKKLIYFLCKLPSFRYSVRGNRKWTKTASG